MPFLLPNQQCQSTEGNKGSHWHWKAKYLRLVEEVVHVWGVVYGSDVRLDTMRDAILTYSQKLTWVSLIYCTEPTTNKWKNRKVKREKRVCSEVSVKSPGNPWSQSWRRKGRLQLEGFAEKEGFKPGMKKWGGDGMLIVISINVSSIKHMVLMRCVGCSFMFVYCVSVCLFVFLFCLAAFIAK